MSKKRSKNYLAAAEKVDSSKKYPLSDAASLVKEISFTKFDSNVEVVFDLNVDTTKADQQLRGAIVLPNGSGNPKTVAVFADGDKAKEAQAAGADFVGTDDLIEKVRGGWTGFDIAIATPDQMAKVGRVGRLLGPKGLMPNPKEGTVTFDVAKAVEDAKGGQVTYRTDKNGNVAVPVGKVSFEADKLVENVKTVSSTIINSRPSTVKGTYVVSAHLASTMSPAVPLEVSSL
ncbi:50S ribosomal protein L1 [Oenococcus alcoholitolerans]|uniref:Large ribosomal subunit protein uL1 n=1 Tax=Oenococcus alcoholitolerans TaxID=931074 RepID=A0ABR4XS37_9LACO|nr:50S ribosomal protein L1 [Oenococcus alcoholitolerans]